MDSPVSFEPLDPKLQVSFYYRLRAIRGRYLHRALGQTVEHVDVAALDKELSAMVPPAALARIASFGLRGELLFPVPLVLRRNPLLLGYYRLLVGFSQKEFYNKGPFGRFRCMEEAGELPARVEPLLGDLCDALIASGVVIAEGVETLSVELVHELQLLTLGPQWRGEENTRIGQRAAAEVFDLIRRIVAPYVIAETRKSIDVRNAANRTVMIQFSADPDVEITETLPDGARPVVSIEIKGGADSSNIHNRLGEAEKSHQKARKLGFLEFWTLVRVDVLPDVLRSESPTTSRVFNLDRLLDFTSDEHVAFVQALTSRIGIPEG